MRSSHPELTTVGCGVDHATHLASGTRDRLSQQWQERCCHEVYGSSIDEEGFGNVISIHVPLYGSSWKKVPCCQRSIDWSNMELPNFSGPSSGPASGFVVHTPALFTSLFMRSACATSHYFASLHIDMAISLGDVMNGTLDTLLVRHIHDKGNDLTPSRANRVCRSVDAGTFFQHFLTSSGDVNFGSIGGQCLSVHLMNTLAGQWFRFVGWRLAAWVMLRRRSGSDGVVLRPIPVPPPVTTSVSRVVFDQILFLFPLTHDNPVLDGEQRGCCERRRHIVVL
jgi:hypothetical protein